MTKLKQDLVATKKKEEDFMEKYDTVVLNTKLIASISALDEAKQ